MEHMAQNSAMMPTGDILSLGRHPERCLPSPKGETRGFRVPWCQARQKGAWLCVHSASGSFSPGLALPERGARLLCFRGWPTPPREALAPTPRDRGPLCGTKEEQPGHSLSSAQPSGLAIRRGFTLGTDP